MSIIRRIDDLGRISIPKEIRRAFFINDGMPLEISTTKDSIVLKRYRPEIPVLDVVDELRRALEDNSCYLEKDVTERVYNHLSEIKTILEE